MNASPDPTSAVTHHRTRIEKRLIRLLNQTGSAATLDDIKAIIFNEKEDRPFIAYLIQLSELFGDDADDDAAIRAIQDVWNYFRHSRLDGRCPAEIILQQVP